MALGRRQQVKGTQVLEGARLCLPRCILYISIALVPSARAARHEARRPRASGAAARVSSGPSPQDPAEAPRAARPPRAWAWSTASDGDSPPHGDAPPLHTPSGVPAERRQEPPAAGTGRGARARQPRVRHESPP